EFVKGGWKLKPLHRLIMTSAVYLQESAVAAPRQSAALSQLPRDSSAKGQTAALSRDAATIDPDNRLLWRRRPQRIESEILRDAMLAVSGTLHPEMFGPAFDAP